jgi:uncharacterized protein with WD repeat
MTKIWISLVLISSLILICHGETKSRIFGKMEKYPTRTGQKLVDPIKSGRLSRGEKKKLAKAEAARYVELRKQGIDEVSNTEEAAALRNYRLRSKKQGAAKKERSISCLGLISGSFSARIPNGRGYDYLR